MEVGRFLRWMMLWSLSLVVVSCDLEDERDLCCDSRVMRYRYPFRSGDCFYQYMSGMEYYLFGDSGRYLGPMEAMEGDIGRVSLAGLPPGRYTLVAIGNRRGYGTPSGHDAPGGRGLRDFRLVVDSLSGSDPDRFANGDPLYWGSRDFVIEEGAANRFVTTMSNVHCRLHVRVEWERHPGTTDGYSLRLDGVGTAMRLHDGGASVIDDRLFPLVTGYGGAMEQAVPMRQFALQAELYTLRYTGRDIPVLRVCRHGEPITAAVPLAEVFARWGWHPDRAPAQDYELTLLIRANGSVEVTRGLGAEVSDWRNGGILS